MRGLLLRRTSSVPHARHYLCSAVPPWSVPVDQKLDRGLIINPDLTTRWSARTFKPRKRGSSLRTWWLGVDLAVCHSCVHLFQRRTHLQTRRYSSPTSGIWTGETERFVACSMPHCLEIIQSTRAEYPPRTNRWTWMAYPV